MRLLLIVALWALVSVPAAYVVSRALRAADGGEIGDEVERYLRRLGLSRMRLAAGRAARITAALAMFAIGVAGTLRIAGDAPAHLVARGFEQRDRLGAPRSLTVVAAPRTATPVAIDERGVIAAGDVVAREPVPVRVTAATPAVTETFVVAAAAAEIAAPVVRARPVHPAVPVDSPVVDSPVVESPDAAIAPSPPSPAPDVAAPDAEVEAEAVSEPAVDDHPGRGHRKGHGHGRAHGRSRHLD